MNGPTTEQKRIIFVDDEPNILQGLQRLLRNHRKEWDMHFVTSGGEALNRLEQEEFDIIVSDLRMPIMDGVTLLSIVKKSYPKMIRFILSGHGDTDLMVRSTGVAHQFMAKPCDAEKFQQAIGRALGLLALFNSQSLQEIISDGTTLPTLPELYRDLSEELQSPESSAEKVAAIIARDITISAKIIQLVNSAFFGLARRIDSIPQAVSLLGSETINSIVLTSQIFDTFDEETIQQFGIRELYKHSLTVGTLAQRLTLHITRDKKKADEAMLAGMMHDLGILALINSKNDAWKNLYINRKTVAKPFHEQERAALGVTHAEIGAYLLGLWGLSNMVVEAVAYHPKPSESTESTEFSSLTAVHIAECFTNKGTDNEHDIVEFDEEYLKTIGIHDRMDELWEFCELETLCQPEK